MWYYYLLFRSHPDVMCASSRSDNDNHLNLIYRKYPYISYGTYSLTYYLCHDTFAEASSIKCRHTIFLNSCLLACVVWVLSLSKHHSDRTLFDLVDNACSYGCPIFVGQKPVPLFYLELRFFQRGYVSLRTGCVHLLAEFKVMALNLIRLTIACVVSYTFVGCYTVLHGWFVCRYGD